MEYSKVIKYWLICGICLVYMQIIIGGITRLTGSGLSITSWDIVIGTVPPLNEKAWTIEFDKYKSTPQYKKINSGMEMSDFKFIYFWEYFHRLWARLMAFCFFLPLLYFLMRKMVDRKLIGKLSVIIIFAMLAAVFGWIMVASGLRDRPWVNAYKLSIHLGIGISVLLTIIWVVISTFYKNQVPSALMRKWKRPISIIFFLLCVQIIIGGIVSGMRAALPYPTWPDMNGEYVPSILLNISSWTVENLMNYEKSAFAPALIQFIHRNLAYVIFFLSIFYVPRMIKDKGSENLRKMSIIYLIFLIVQVVLGIITLLSSIGSVPVFLGVAHQGIGVLLLSSLFIIKYWLDNSAGNNSSIQFS